MTTGRLRVQNIWSEGKYYKKAKTGSLDVTHPGMKLLIDLSKNAKKILDLGCGEGSRLNLVSRGKSYSLGVDISSKAIKLAKKTYPNLGFKRADLEKLPFKDCDFDLVYCAFVLEHLNNPEKVINEAIRVLKKGGHLMFISPNFGAPNRSSPPFKGSRLSKFLCGLCKDIKAVFKLADNNLNWNKVVPIASRKKYYSDWDTSVEPYIGSLVRDLEGKGLKIKIFNSCWAQELENPKAIQKVFRFLGERGLHPFNLWGPHLLVVASK